MNDETQVEESEKQEMTVEVDGVKYPISALSDNAREMVRMHHVWSNDLQEATRDLNEVSDRVNMMRAAITQVGNQVIAQVRADVAAKTEETPPAE